MDEIMGTPLDLDQLQTFCAVADCSSFTEAARRVNKTQSAVSMQIKRLEDRLGAPLFSREGKKVALTRSGEELYSRARRMLRTNAEIMDMFSGDDLAGTIRFGVPDDYAVRLLPVVLSHFQRSHPKIAVDVKCMSSEDLLAGMRNGRFDLIVFSQGTLDQYGELFRTEKMHWVASHSGAALAADPLPVACGPTTCCWRIDAIEALNRVGRDYRIAYTSSDATSIQSAVLADLAVGILPESAMQPGMRPVLDHGLPKLHNAQIAIMRASHAYGNIYDALASHIVASMGNLDAKQVAIAS